MVGVFCCLVVFAGLNNKYIYNFLLKLCRKNWPFVWEALSGCVFSLFCVILLKSMRNVHKFLLKFCE